jgi:competence protein ComEA
MLNLTTKLVATLTLILMLSMPLTTFALAPINVNTATTIELQTIKGIGPKMAEKIIAYRSQHGQFSTVGDLCAVQGIGEKTLLKMGNTVCVE